MFVVTNATPCIAADAAAKPATTRRRCSRPKFRRPTVMVVKKTNDANSSVLFDAIGPDSNPNEYKLVPVGPPDRRSRRQSSALSRELQAEVIAAAKQRIARRRNCLADEIEADKARALALPRAAFWLSLCEMAPKEDADEEPVPLVSTPVVEAAKDTEEEPASLDSTPAVEADAQELAVGPDSNPTQYKRVLVDSAPASRAAVQEASPVALDTKPVLLQEAVVTAVTGRRVQWDANVVSATVEFDTFFSPASLAAEEDVEASLGLSANVAGVSTEHDLTQSEPIVDKPPVEQAVQLVGNVKPVMPKSSVDDDAPAPDETKAGPEAKASRRGVTSVSGDSASAHVPIWAKQTASSKAKRAKESSGSNAGRSSKPTSATARRGGSASSKSVKGTAFERPALRSSKPASATARQGGNASSKSVKSNASKRSAPRPSQPASATSRQTGSASTKSVKSTTASKRPAPRLRQPTTVTARRGISASTKFVKSTTASKLPATRPRKLTSATSGRGGCASTKSFASTKSASSKKPASLLKQPTSATSGRGGSATGFGRRSTPSARPFGSRASNAASAGHRPGGTIASSSSKAKAGPSKTAPSRRFGTGQ